MRTIGHLLTCLLLTAPALHAAFGPLDLELIDRGHVATLARVVEHQVNAQTNRLGLYLAVPAAQLRALSDLPVMRELARSIGLLDLAGLLTTETSEHSSREPRRISSARCS